MMGAAPVAVRRRVTPRTRLPEREQFVIPKTPIAGLYTSTDDHVHYGSFRDHAALRVAAGIVIEAAGTLHVLFEQPDI